MRDQRGDEELMTAYAGGEVEAFALLYERHKGGLYRYLLRQCRNAAEAQELFQEVWLSVVRARERYQVRARFRTYLYHLARNRLIDHYRRRAHNPTSGRLVESLDSDKAEGENAGAMAVDAPAPEELLHGKRLGARLLQALAALPAAQREAFLLREEAGLSVEEIGELTGVGSETAKSRLRYALAKLRRVFETSG